MINFKTKLGKYFTLGEMIRHREDNTPDDLQLINLTQLCCKVLDPIREEFGQTIITSGYRNPHYNKSVGGSNNSQHTKGQAADFIIHNKNMKDVYKWIMDNLEYDQVIFEKVGDKIWIHISYNIINNRKQSLIFLDNTYYTYDGYSIEHT